MSGNPIPERYLADRLFLLVGTNPLPNLVAARLLAAPGGTVWLLHSDGNDGEPSTKNLAQNIEMALMDKRPDLRIRPMDISSSNNLRIENLMGKIIKEGEVAGKVGLNYTGGTKPMSLHCYRVLEQAFASAEPKPVFSYLDPRKVALRIDGRETRPCEIFTVPDNDALRKSVEATVDEIASLHGYVRVREGSVPASGGASALVPAIVDVYASPSGARQWIEWINKTEVKDLPGLADYPALREVRAAMDDLCGGRASPDSLAQCLLSGHASPALSSCITWLKGIWLEDYCQLCFASISARLPITSYDRNMHYKAKRESSDYFELDAAAMVGYQLFAVSCAASQRKSYLKEHLFEAYVRGRQIGGDEARVCLVCSFDAPEFLEKEIAREWDAKGKIRVFGRKHLKDLAAHLGAWIEAANK